MSGRVRPSRMPSSTSPCSWVSAASRPATASAVKLGQRCVALDEQAGPQAADEGEGLQEPLRGAFAGEWLPQIGHQHVAGEQHAARRKVDHQRVCGFPARRWIKDKLGAPYGQWRRLADELVGDDGRGDTPGGSGEVAEQWPVTLLT